METKDNEKNCPLCDRPMEKKTKRLYGHSVCKKCYGGFAGRRQIAFLIDVGVFLCIAPAILAMIADLLAGIPWLRDAVSIPLFFIWLPSFFLKDGFQGYSPGKAIMGVQVVDSATNEPTGFGPSFKRNIPLIIGIVLLIVPFQLYKGNRIGDGWAETCVVWKKYRNKRPFRFSNVGGDVVVRRDS
jgi:uncharacterized RDD family membrane protein YckC